METDPRYDPIFDSDTRNSRVPDTQWLALIALVLVAALTATGCQRTGASFMLEPHAPPAYVAVPSAHPSMPRAPSATATVARTPRPHNVIVDAARTCIGDRYDASYYAGGPPPKGRGACTDVLYCAAHAVHIDLQRAVNTDIRRNPAGYPNLRDDNIDYRWAPNLIVWFKRHTQGVANDADWQAGDIVFWSLEDDGVADHCGIISDRAGSRAPLVIHNYPPRCREDDALHQWRIMGHFRFRRIVRRS